MQSHVRNNGPHLSYLIGNIEPSWRRVAKQYSDPPPPCWGPTPLCDQQECTIPRLDTPTGSRIWIRKLSSGVQPEERTYSLRATKHTTTEPANRPRTGLADN